MGICTRIVNYTSRIKSADEEIGRLKNQTQLLSNVFSDLNERFHIELVHRTVKAASDDGNGIYGQYWNSLKESLSHCRDRLCKLEDLLKNRSRGGVFSRVIGHRLLAPIRLDSQKEEINNYLREINFYRDAMGIALQFITLYSLISCFESLLITRR